MFGVLKSVKKKTETILYLQCHPLFLVDPRDLLGQAVPVQ